MHLVDEVFAGLVACRDACATRRQLLLAPLPLAVLATAAQASKINPSETAITLPDEIRWVAWSGLPPHSGEMATLYGGLDKPGPYLVLMKWYPGYMSAPHSYATDRLSLVLSGTWWVGQGVNWDPEHVTAPVKPGTFVTHYARQVHYDGARKDNAEPAVELVWGMGPVATIPCDGPNAEKGPGPCDDARKAEK